MLGYLLRKNPFELYSMEVEDDGFVFRIKEVFYIWLCELIQDKDLVQQFKAIHVRIESGVASMNISLPFISFPNYRHQKIDWESLAIYAEQIQLFFWVVNFKFNDTLPDEYFFGQNYQHMLIETQYSRSFESHGCSMTVGFTEQVSARFKEKYPTGYVANASQNVALRFYLGLTSRRLREYERSERLHLKYGAGFSSVKAVVRPEGVPHFIVPGNCACLGANPDEFQYDNDMYSHNLDTSVQQMAMLAAVVTFWNDVVKPMMK